MLKTIICTSFVLLSAFCFAEGEPAITSICSEKECYFIDEELGSGAFGMVYAVHDSAGQRYALKSYHPNDFSSDIALALKDAEREYNIGQQLNHPNIMKTIDWFTDANGSYYLLLELVVGERVAEQPRKSLTGEQAIQLTYQLAEGLKHGIEMEYIYLDLHGNNVMISDDMEIKLIDVSSFFSFDEIRQMYSKGIHVKNEKVRKFVQRHQAQFDQIKKRKNLTKDWAVNYFLAWIFDEMIDMQLTILNKSTMDRAEKIKMFSALKEVGWNYSEDLQDGIEQPPEHYYNQLTEILKTY